MKTLQQFASAHAAFHKHVQRERHGLGEVRLTGDKSPLD